MTTGPVTVGVDLGGTYLKWALVDRDGEVVGRGEVPSAHADPDTTVEAVVGLCRQNAPISALGVGVPGLFDREQGVVRFLPNLPAAWSGFPLAERLRGALEVPVMLANDARCFALAESRLGAALGVPNALFVTLGTGVGGALVIDGQVYLGWGGGAGEFGHQTVDPAGPLCGCGNHGCVETFASAPAVVAAAVRGILQGIPTSVSDRCNGRVDELTARDVVAAAAEGDALALDALGRASSALGIALANACVLLSPERIVVGGGFGHALDQLRGRIESELSQRVRVVPRCAIVGAALDVFAGAIGAALWVSAGEEGGRRTDR
jgi:glucokinase